MLKQPVDGNVLQSYIQFQDMDENSTDKNSSYMNIVCTRQYFSSGSYHTVLPSCGATSLDTLNYSIP